jgi:AraC-like DNA-binding protein
MKPIFLSLIILLSFNAIAQDNEHKKASLRNVIKHSEGKEKTDTYKALSFIYMNEALYNEQKRDALFALFDEMGAEAKKQGNEELFESIMHVRMTNLMNFKAYDEVIKLSPEYLKFFEKNQSWDNYYRIYRLLVSAYRLKQKDNEALAIAQEMYQHAKEKGNNLGMGLAFFEMSRIYHSKRRFTEEEKCLRDCIVLIQDSISYIPQLLDTYEKLGCCLIAQKKYDNAIQLANEMEPAIKRYEEMENSPQPNAWRQQYTIYLDAYRQSEDYVNAEIYCNKIDSIANGKYDLYEAKAEIALSKKKYTEALELIDKAIEVASLTGKLSPMAAKLSIWLLTQGQKGEEMDNLYRDILNRLETKHNEQMTIQLDELRTQYEVEKIQHERDMAHSEKKQLRSYMFFALGGCLLLLVLLAIYIYYYRLIRKKNLALFRQIKGQDLLAEQLSRMEQQYEIGETEHAPSLHGTQQQQQLVAHFHKYLQKDNNYVNSEINIDHIIPILATNRTYFFEAIKEVTKKTPMEYIRALQLEEAKKMLENNLELSVENIAGECGFNTRNTFYRLFREQYQISPKEYRNMVKYV